MTTTGSLHGRIYTELEDRILSGEWQPGVRIPFEHELTEQYGCSRMTVNKAISELAGRGLVIRRRRAGTFVAAPRTHAAVLAIPDLRAEVTARGEVYGYRLLGRRDRAPVSEDEIALAAGGRLLELESLHSSDGSPFALERRLIALNAAPDAQEMDFSDTPPGSWLLDATPWTDAEHRISAVAALPAEARHLKLKPGVACLCIERRTWRDGQGVTRVSQIFPGDRYDLIARFSPARSGAR